MYRALPLLALLVTPVFAQGTANQMPAKGTPGAVGQYAIAHTLFSQSAASKDALAMLTAAKLASAVDLNPVERKPETTGSPAPDQPDAHNAPLDAATMLAATRALIAEDDTLIALLAEAESGNALVRAGTANSSQHALPAGQTDTFKLPFDGEALAEITLIGDGDSNLDLTVTDATGQIICADPTPADIAHCGFAPAETGYFTATVQNHGPGLNSYLLISN